MDGNAIKTALGKNIKHIRLQNGLTQAVFAEKAKISIIFLSSIERGTKYPKADILARISETLGVEVFELFKGDLVPADSKKLVTRLSKDITSKINHALNDIFKHYLG